MAPEWSWKAKIPWAGARGVVEIGARLPVDRRLDLRADGDDFIRVPLAEFDILFTRLLPEQAAAEFLVDLAPPVRADIGLVSFDLVIGGGLTAELDAAVALVVNKLDLEGQLEVRAEQVGAEERVVLEARSSCRRSRRSRPTRGHFPLPAGQVAAVEERAGVLGRGEHRDLCGLAR